MRYSAISTAYQCYEKYRRIYIAGEQSDQTSGDMAFGTALHAALASKMNGFDGKVTFDLTWKESENKPLSYSRHKWQELQEMSGVFLDRFERLHEKHFTPTMVEQKMNFFVGDVAFEGTPDFVGVYRDTPSIVDWKTSGYEYPKTKIITNEQMYLYAHAVKQVYGYDVKQLVYVVFIKNPAPRIQTIVYPLTDEKMQSMLENVKIMAKDLTNRTEWPKNRNGCQYCEFKPQCYKGEL